MCITLSILLLLLYGVCTDFSIYCYYSQIAQYKNIIMTIIDALPIIFHSPSPVSYTHLDVYKRQLLK